MDEAVGHLAHAGFAAGWGILDARFAEIFRGDDVAGILGIMDREFEVFHVRQDAPRTCGP